MDSTNKPTARLGRLARTINLNGQEYLVTAHADPFEPTRCRIFSAWVRSSIMGRHQTITSEAGWGFVGEVGTERDEERYGHLAGGSDERIAAINQARTEREQEAHAAIRAAFPEVGDFQPDVFMPHRARSRAEVAA
jgi:hypothetical protein